MPKSKRNKVVHLTKTVSKGRRGKSANIDKLQALCDKYKTIYLFRCVYKEQNLVL